MERTGSSSGVHFFRTTVGTPLPTLALSNLEMMSKILDGVMYISLSIDPALGAVSSVGTQRNLKKNK